MSQQQDNLGAPGTRQPNASPQTCGIDELSAHVARCGYQPAALLTLPADLVERPQSWNARQLALWRDALEQCWQRYAPAEDNFQLALQFARQAWAVELWGLVRQALRVLLQHGGDRADIWAWLGVCESQCGRQDEAVNALMQALALDESDPQISELIRDISPRWARQHELVAVARRGPILRLEPLGLQHAHSVLWQYRDPQIAAWAAMDPLPDLDSVRTWITQTGNRPGRSSFAVMHADDGFVGEVVYSGHGDAAFVHYWIGCDHQGKGYAAPAVAMMCAQAASKGFALLFTSCRPENIRSMRVLVRNGFSAMNMPPLGSDDKNLNFYVLPLLGQRVDQSVDRLSALLEWLDCPLVLANNQKAPRNPKTRQGKRFSHHSSRRQPGAEKATPNGLFEPQR